MTEEYVRFAALMLMVLYMAVNIKMTGSALVGNYVKPLKGTLFLIIEILISLWVALELVKCGKIVFFA